MVVLMVKEEELVLLAVWGCITAPTQHPRLPPSVLRVGQPRPPWREESCGVEGARWGTGTRGVGGAGAAAGRAVAFHSPLQGARDTQLGAFQIRCSKGGLASIQACPRFPDSGLGREVGWEASQAAQEHG